LTYGQLWQRAGTDVQPRPLRHANDVHWIPDEQLIEPEHRMSHAQELPHDTFLHELVPPQLIEHGPEPHCTFSHELFDVHSMLHDAAAWQLMPLRHDPSTLHAMSHL